MNADIQQQIETTVTAMGYELLALEGCGGREPVLRLYLDHPQGVSLQACAQVSRQLEGVLAVAGLNYRLEVSSPGLDRPLSKPAHFLRFVGRRAQISLEEGVLEQSSLTGRIVSADETQVTVESEGGPQSIAFEHIVRARLSPQFEPGSCRLVD